MTPGAGREHLAVIAGGPRAAGSEGERAAREYCAQVLQSAGFGVSLERFEYSTLPGRFGTPAGSAVALVSVLVACWIATVRGSPVAAAAVLSGGLALVALAAWRMLGHGVLTIPWGRSFSHNLVAQRGARAPRVWLVAHLDSKSQPVPSALRVIGIITLASGIALTLVAAMLTLGGGGTRTLWWIGAALTTVGAIPVMLSVVGNASDGAVDNASGVAAVLLAASKVPYDVSIGVLLPSAEELGLAGARAWVRGRAIPGATALNCDGVDDDGELTIMYSGARPTMIIAAIADVAERAQRVRRLPLGLLTDSVAFTDAGWHAVTVSRGSLATLRRVHTRRDSLETLRGDGIEEVGTVLARAAEALAR